KQKLAMPRLEQLRQRIAVYFHLTPLDKEDSLKYIRHRLHVASASGREYFTEEALQRVYEFSRGVPRLMNQICDSALLSGFIYGASIIDEKIMQEVIKESPMEQIAASAQKTIRKLDDFEAGKVEGLIQTG
ncbi:MAG: hypothetical protein U1D99_00070, partial [Candidatus Omnitrophota bacterium]|nr:hypothetical protein [Candidatus Omnitrophota bacterium]